MVLLTEAAMGTLEVILEVEVETVRAVSQVEDAVAPGEVVTLEEGVTPAEIKIPVVTKEVMEEGISHNRMARGTR